VPVNIVALAYGLGALLDMIWPRSPDQPWYINAGMIVAIAGIGSTGLLYMMASGRYDIGTTPSADAWLLRKATPTVSIGTGDPL
jgi:hypothetical protein